MRAVVLQAPYPPAPSRKGALECMDWMLTEVRSLMPGAQDLVILPEYANAPGIDTADLLHKMAEREGAEFVHALAQEARRLNSLVAVGAVTKVSERWMNRVHLFAPSGDEVFAYDKVHLTDAEVEKLGLDAGAEIQVFDWKGLRIGFATCFDLYFPEHFEALAAQSVDLVIAPSYQRSETGERIELITRTRALDTGCYVLRSSYAMPVSEKGGHSLLVSPTGRVLVMAGTKPAVLTVEFDPKEKFVKPRSHGEPPMEHRALLEAHRRPALYRRRVEQRNVLDQAPLPWLCAHRGLSCACPENTLPAFAAALALGVHEIELDLWLTRDGVPVVCHDPSVDRTTDGHGIVTEMCWADIRRLDAGIRMGVPWQNISIPRFEEVLALVDGRAMLNLHIKDPGPDGALVKKVCDLLRTHGVTRLAYIAGDEAVLRIAKEYAPEIERACLAKQDDPASQIVVARQFDCHRVQFSRAVTSEDIRRAHDAGMLCNLFYSDEPADAMAYLSQGIDVILTNCPQVLLAAGLSSPVGF